MQRLRFHATYFHYAGLKVNIYLILTLGVDEATQMCLDVVDGPYSFKCNSPVNFVVMDLKGLCAAGELIEYNHTFVEGTRWLC